MKTVRVLSLAIVIVAAGLSPALAAPLEGQDEESRILSDTWSGSLGWFGADVTTDIAVGFGRIAGTQIRLEDDLSIDENKDSFRLGGRYRFNRKHAITFGGFQLNRKGSRTIDRDIEIEDPDSDGGLRFTAGGDVTSELDNDVVAVYYSYSFFNNGKVETGLSIGLSTYSFELILEGDVELLDEDGNLIGSAAGRQSDSDITAPVPAYGVYVNYAVSPKVIFSFNAAMLNLDVSDYEGRVADTKGTVEWFFSKHVSVGAGITNTSIEVRDTGEDPFSIDYRYGGFLAYMGVAF